MSSAFMLLIAAMYAGACVSFMADGKWLWAGVAACWGIGNFLIALLSK